VQRTETPIMSALTTALNKIQTQHMHARNTVANPRWSIIKTSRYFNGTAHHYGELWHEVESVAGQARVGRAVAARRRPEMSPAERPFSAPAEPHSSRVHTPHSSSGVAVQFLIMVALCNRADHYIFFPVISFYLSIYLSRDQHRQLQYH